MDSRRRYPFVISIPHCSNRIPEEIKDSFALNDEEIEESTDVGTREIFGAIPVFNVYCAYWSRLAVDLNRGPDQDGPKGVVPRIDYCSRDIYLREALPDVVEMERRVRLYYQPYHQELRSAVERSEIAGLFDCHSLNGTGPPEAPDPGQQRKDVTLSNNGDDEGCAKDGFGEITCSPSFLQGVKGVFEDSGFSVSLNRPYSGGYITTHYGRVLSEKRKMALQVEINQSLYCIPRTLRPLPEKMEAVSKRMMRVFSDLSTLVEKRLHL